ncbi:MAG: DMT family transporter [Gemmataceae bacterium]|nr:DMT family transporter [Gemmataceae bacterium]
MPTPRRSPGREAIDRSNPRPYAWMLSGAFVLAWMNQFAHMLKDSCDWRLIALARALLALVFALGMARAAGAALVLWKPTALWLRGAASSASLLCLFYALTRIHPAEAVALSNTVPIWVAFLSWPLIGTAPTGGVWLSALLGSAGVALMQAQHWDKMSASWASALALLAALTSAIAMLGLNRLRQLHPLAVVVHYSAFATVVVGAACLAGSTPSFSPLANPATVGLLLAVGATATVGQLCVTRAFTEGDPARVAVVGLTQIVFALLFNTLVSQEWPHPLTVAGIALVLLPTAWVTATRAAKSAAAPEQKAEAA